MSKREPLKVGQRVVVDGVWSDSGKPFKDRGTIVEERHPHYRVQFDDGQVHWQMRREINRLRKRKREPERVDSRERWRIRRWQMIECGTEAPGLPRHVTGTNLFADLAGESEKPNLVMVELRPGERLISRSDLEKAWNEMINDTREHEGVFDSLMRHLGFKQEGGGK